MIPISPAEAHKPYAREEVHICNTTFALLGVCDLVLDDNYGDRERETTKPIYLHCVCGQSSAQQVTSTNASAALIFDQR